MFYKNHRTSLSLSKLRQQPPAQQLPTNPPDWSSDDHADLLSRDKTKVKDAIRRYLSEKVRNDWVFNWPPIPAGELAPAAADVQQEPETLEQRDHANIQDEPNDDAGYQVDEESDPAEDLEMGDNDEDDDAQSVYSIMTADPAHYKPRIDWDSDAPVEEPTTNRATGTQDQQEGIDPQVLRLKRRAQKRRELREEIEWNEGLACFEARRNAWTHARTVRLRAKPETPQSPSSQRSSRRFFFRRLSSTSSQGANSQSGASAVLSEVSPHREAEKEPSKHHDKASSSTGSADASVELCPVETIVPVPPPILPPSNPLRASITFGNYLQLYDKLIVHNLQPACPINLSDMIGACVAGWKRDGEWPPRSTLPVDPIFNAHNAARNKKRAAAVNTNDKPAHHGRRLSLTGFLSRDKDTESRTGKGVRQSLQKAFGLGSPMHPHMDAPVAPEKTAHR
ncbi:hypothetical protein ACO1O0_007426 [Amphichorda felina]